MMVWARQITHLFRRLLDPHATEGELDEEVQSFFETMVERRMSEGMGRDQAQRAARLTFDSSDRVKEKVRDARFGTGIETVLQDVRYAARALRKQPAFTGVAIVILAVGIGASAAVFSIVNQVLLRPAGIRNPERVVTVRTSYAKLNLEFFGSSTRNLPDVQNSPNVFERAALVTVRDLSYTSGGSAQRIRAAAVTRDWFDVFGIHPLLGRTFLPQEDAPNANRVVILSYALWKRLFGGDTNLLDRVMELNQVPYRIIGVMGPDFHQPTLADLWSPAGLPPAAFTDEARFNENMGLVARMKPGITVESAKNWMRVLTQRVYEAPKQGQIANEARWSITVDPYLDALAVDTKTALLVLFGVTGFVVLIVCANIAGLLLSRASVRAREFAVRAALGASRARLVRSIMSESVLLAIGGALAGIAVTYTSVQVLIAMAPQDIAPMLTAHVDLMTLSFSAVIAAASAILFGSAPAWRVSRAKGSCELAGEGRASTSGKSRQTARSMIVVVESALALILLVCGGLFLRSFRELQAVNPGFEPRGVMSATFALPPQLYPRGGTERGVFYRSVLQRLEGSPGIESAALAQPAPFIGGINAGNFDIVGRLRQPGEAQPHGNDRTVSPNYFTTLKIPLRRGRFFADSDADKSEGVIIIDEVLAMKYWPNEDPIGKFVDRTGKRRIIGIVGHVLHTSLLPDNGEGTYYVPLYQRGFIAGQIVARTAGDVNQLASAIREAVHDADPRIAVDQFMTMEEAVARSLAPRRFAMQLVAFFALIGLFLSALGLYGVISYSVTQRTREIGIRMALGADQPRVLRMVLDHALRLAGAGAAIGLIASAAGVRLIQRELYGVKAFDPTTIVAAVAVLAIAALIASYLPARRAVRVDPALALRPE